MIGYLQVRFKTIQLSSWFSDSNEKIIALVPFYTAL